ncbi:pyridoxamine 5'-phosphate oxidase family protein [Convivina praedatoris]|uniref:Pyridoxamine 5'-phosphate oxidase putative domain-containing protein n=1 Tax=Convivina praedatoris TaxID=2880963 RepID=A0ABN8H994_9LACO|nr:pyridoxamine 5'-phosphate oxidase family protein [Convivina sp. LMG 32447]CAH1852055.1 hypothetical protein R077815_00471 [Convivina sp. LMG 32447]CAH1853917.1 hypothetical protein R078138_00759 [Convivina sp. LMG 32447]CAH1854152.1 hypothetical protein LMG032447_00803 [Convivina sp. LMG 32447]
MYLKRFVQLFVVFFVTIILSEWLATVLKFNNLGIRIIFVTIIGYLLLTIPLTILTILKNQRKFGKNNSASTQMTHFRQLLQDGSNLIALATVNQAGKLATSVITFKESHNNDNVLYLVSDWQSTRVKNLQVNSTAAFTTWYDDKTGQRISSNELTIEVLTEQEAEIEIKHHPEILDLTENARKQAVIKITLESVLIESFQGQPEIIKW